MLLCGVASGTGGRAYAPGAAYDRGGGGTDGPAGAAGPTGAADTVGVTGAADTAGAVNAMGTVGANSGGAGGAGAADVGGAGAAGTGCGARPAAWKFGGPAACGLEGGGGGGAALMGAWYGRSHRPGQSKFLDSFGPGAGRRRARARTSPGQFPGDNTDRGGPSRLGRASDEWLLRLDSNQQPSD